MPTELGKIVVSLDTAISFLFRENLRNVFRPVFVEVYRIISSKITGEIALIMSERAFKNTKIKCLFLIVSALLITSCRTPPKTDLRNLAPSDTLVYLETNDVAATLEALIASPAFQTLAKNEIDFSALKNTQMAVIVTGFETSEENSAINFKPRFVAVAETHAWSWQTVSLVENQLDNFVKKNYGDTAKREKSDQDGGRFFTWTAPDNRRVFAFARDSLIYFGNDAAAIEKCLAVGKGEAESLLENEFFTRAYSENNLAFGYVSTEGTSQIAALIGVSAAVSVSEEAGERSFIARTLPQILQNTVREIVWTANRSERGIEDKYSVILKPEKIAVVKEILNAGSDTPANSTDFLPSDIFSATRYNLKNPLLAWRGALLLTAGSLDALSGKILIEFSGKLLEPYGIGEATTFLSAINSPVTTAQLDAEGERSVSIVAVKDLKKLKTAISKDIDFKSPPEKTLNAEIWFSDDKNLAAAFVADKLILGDGESVLKCLRAKENELIFIKSPAFQTFAESRFVAATFGRDIDSAKKIVGVLANLNDENRNLATFYTTETRLTENGFERRTVSDFGLIGTILEKLNFDINAVEVKDSDADEFPAFIVVSKFARCVWRR